MKFYSDSWLLKATIHMKKMKGLRSKNWQLQNSHGDVEVQPKKYSQ